MNDFKNILLAEDNPDDAKLILLALGKSNIVNKVVHVKDGAEALDYLKCSGKYADRETGNPLVAFLDLRMPNVDGLQVAKHIKSDEKLKTIPTVIITSSKEEKDLIESYDLGVNSYIVKPVEFKKFVETIKQIGIFWTLINEAPLKT